MEQVPPDYDPREMLELGADAGLEPAPHRHGDNDDVDGGSGRNGNYRVGFFWYGRPLPISHGVVSVLLSLPYCCLWLASGLCGRVARQAGSGVSWFFVVFFLYSFCCFFLY